MASQWAMELAAQAWCTPKTRHKNMDPSLTMAFAEILDKEFINYLLLEQSAHALANSKNWHEEAKLEPVRKSNPFYKFGE